LSRGLSLTGNQPGDPCGSLTTKAPSSVGTKPSIDLSGSVIGLGVPEYPTSTVKASPASNGAAGVIRSSCTSRSTKSAGLPFTRTLDTR
jgi:hypothetical protein